MMVCLQGVERDTARVREEVGSERNCRIEVEDNFIATLKKVVNKMVVKALKWAHLEAKAERMRERERDNP